MAKKAETVAEPKNVVRTHELIKLQQDADKIFIAFLWKNPSLYNNVKDFQVNKGTFVDRSILVYYRSGLEMYKAGISKFDTTAVSNYLKHRKAKREVFQNAGGWETIQDFIGMLETSDKEISVENFEYYLDEIIKYNMARNLEDAGVINFKHDGMLEILQSMNSEEFREYLITHVGNSAQNVSSHNRIVSPFLSNSIFDTIKEMIKPPKEGVVLTSATRLNRMINTWQRGKMLQVIMPSGLGKSTFVRTVWVPDLIKSEECKSVVIFINEEDAETWRRHFLITDSNQYLISQKAPKDNYLYKSKIFAGEITEGQKALLNERAAVLLNETEDMIIDIVEIKSQSIAEIKQHIRDNKHKNYDTMILDTFKPSANASDNLARWEVFAKDVQELYDLIKPSGLNMRCLITAQMKLGYNIRYLGLDSVGKSKEIVEVADTVMLCRELFADEYSGEANDLQPFLLEPKEGGGYNKVPVTLDKAKRHIILFFGKNRNGSTSQQIIFEVNYDMGLFYEKGLCEMKLVGA